MTPTPYSIFHSLYKDINGYELSTKSRNKLSYFYRAHTYGEIHYKSFFEALKAVDPKPNEVYYDLGSGIGNTVIQAHLLAPFSKTIGIELLPDLHITAVSLLDRYKQEFLPQLPEKQNSEIIFKQGDFKNYDISDADVIYMNGVLYDYELLSDKFLQKLENVKKGTRIISVEVPLHELLNHTHLETLTLPFSWNEQVAVHIYEKK